MVKLTACHHLIKFNARESWMICDIRQSKLASIVPSVYTGRMRTQPGAVKLVL